MRHTLFDGAPKLCVRLRRYVEGRDLFQFRRTANTALRDEGLDVVVTDGFTGNVVLKTAEGAGRFSADSLRSEVKRSLLAQLGALLMMPALKSCGVSSMLKVVAVPPVWRKRWRSSATDAPVLGQLPVQCRLPKNTSSPD